MTAPVERTIVSSSMRSSHPRYGEVAFTWSTSKRRIVGVGGGGRWLVTNGGLSPFKELKASHILLGFTSHNGR